MSRIIFWTSTLFALAFLIVPLVLIMPLAFNESSFLTYPIESFSLKWFHEVFVQEQWARSFLNSLNVAIGTTFVALLVGGLAAAGVALLNRWLQTVLTALFVSPMVVPSIVIGVAFALVSNFNHGWPQNAYCNRPLLISMINRVLKQIGNGTLYRLTITTDVNDFGIVIENHVVSSSECERRHIRNHLPGSGDNIYRMELV